MVYTRQSFFSISFDFVTLDREIPFDLYINSSSRSEKEKFVKIFPRGDVIEQDDMEYFKRKYHQLYVLESQRGEYLKSFVNSENADDQEKTKVIKDSAIIYLNKVFDSTKEFNTELLSETISGCRDSVASMVEVIKDYDVSDVQSLIGDLSFHDFYTYDHSINVSMYSIAIFKSLKPRASKNEMTMAGLGGLLHDLGKIKIPTHILNNPGKLSDDDFKQIKQHPDYGLELIGDEKVKVEGVDFNIIKRIIHEHHENYNGTGYPNQLKGREIHVMARIVAIADFFDALTTKRSYHDVLSAEDALEVMSKSVAKKIDPKIFEVFTKGVKNLVLKGNSKLILPDSFDPCQPQNVLPYEKMKIQKKAEDIFKKDQSPPSYGAVKGDTEIIPSKKKKAS